MKRLLLTPQMKALVAGVASAALTGCASHPKPPPAPAHEYAPSSPTGPGYPAPAPGPVSSQPLPGTVQDFVINIGDQVYFDFDQATIRDDAKPVLSAQADWLQRYPAVRVRIEGNCDERGTREYNFALGARRADAVRAFLSDHGVAPSRIATISYGKEQPIDPGHDEGAWAKDRNAHTDIIEGHADRPKTPAYRHQRRRRCRADAGLLAAAGRARADADRVGAVAAHRRLHDRLLGRGFRGRAADGSDAGHTGRGIRPSGCPLR